MFETARIITLGCCCEVVFLKQKLFPNIPHSPLDWLAVFDPTILPDIIRDRFNPLRAMNLPILNPHHMTPDSINRRIERVMYSIENEPYVLFVIKCHHDNVIDRKSYSGALRPETAREIADALVSLRGPHKPFDLLVVNEHVGTESPETIVIESNDGYQIVIDWMSGIPKHPGGMLVNCDFPRDSNNAYHTQRWQAILSRFESKL